MNNDNNIIEVKSLRISLSERKASLEGKDLELTPKEFDLLGHLLSNMNRVYTREELLDLIWGMDYFGGTRTVDIHVQRLRKKLGDDYQNIIQTVYKVGYKAMGEINEI